VYGKPKNLPRGAGEKELKFKSSVGHGGHGEKPSGITKIK
jgi:hypothetical protein